MQIKDIDLEWLGHSGFKIKNSKIIYIDPYKIQDNEPADIILITHSHYDHCSIEDISKIVKSGTIIIMPADCQSKITKIEKQIKIKILQPNQGINIENLKIIAIPAYNLNKKFHPKSEQWNGYIIDTGQIKIYHAGDTDLIPEMKQLAKYNLDIALVPVGGTYTMNEQEAVKSVLLIKPKIAIPMHFGEIVGSQSDAEQFVELCRQQGIQAQILEKK